MANQQNLDDHKYINGDERAAENGRAGGIASGIAKREKRTIRAALEELFEKEYNINNPSNPAERKNVAGSEALAIVMMGKALKGDTKAWELVRDTAGQKPIENMNLNATVSTPYDELTAEELRLLLKKHEDGAI